MRGRRLTATTNAMIMRPAPTSSAPSAANRPRKKPTMPGRPQRNLAVSEIATVANAGHAVQRSALGDRFRDADRDFVSANSKAPRPCHDGAFQPSSASRYLANELAGLCRASWLPHATESQNAAALVRNRGPQAQSASGRRHPDNVSARPGAGSDRQVWQIARNERRLIEILDVGEP
jgi:hypothetical protein